MNFGKFLFELNKKKHAAKKKQKQVQVKEIKFRPATDESDYQIKLRSLRKFLENGDKAKVTLRFRGREMAHQELGSDMLKRVETDLEDIGQVEQYPKLEGRQMVMVVAPRKIKNNGKVRCQKLKQIAAQRKGSLKLDLEKLKDVNLLRIIS